MDYSEGMAQCTGESPRWIVAFLFLPVRLKELDVYHLPAVGVKKLNS